MRSIDQKADCHGEMVKVGTGLGGDRKMSLAYRRDEDTRVLRADISDPASILARGREVVQLEAEALIGLSEHLDNSFVEAARIISGTKRQLVVTGMGKSGHIGRKVAATFAATGTPAIFIHPAEAAHGDLGMLAAGDVLVVFSNSGNTKELRSILIYARELEIPTIGIASHTASLVMDHASVQVCFPSVKEACAANIAPTTSTIMQLAIGDALAMAVMEMREVTRASLAALHPGGIIGLRLTPVSELMSLGDRLPLALAEDDMIEVISRVTTGRFGIVGVIDGDGGLVGVITDGDIRRHFAVLGTAKAADVMTSHPRMIPSDLLAGDALALLNENQITAAFVFERGAQGPLMQPVGIVHIHDLLRFELGCS